MSTPAPTQTPSIPGPRVKCIKYTTMTWDRIKATIGTLPDGAIPFDELESILTSYYGQYWVLISNVLAGEIGVAILFRSIDTVPQHLQAQWLKQMMENPEIVIDPSRSTQFTE